MSDVSDIDASTAAGTSPPSPALRPVLRSVERRGVWTVPSQLTVRACWAAEEPAT